MSDGTLRALGVLVALFQVPTTASSLPLIAIEEPEVALHPAAADVLRDALLEAGETRQVLASSHSPELLDSPEVEPDQIIAVTADEGTTYLARPDRAGMQALKEHLYTAGELLRMNQLIPDEEAVSEAKQMKLFEASN
jgi:predicted ATPase